MGERLREGGRKAAPGARSLPRSAHTHTLVPSDTHRATHVTPNAHGHGRQHGAGLGRVPCLVGLVVTKAASLPTLGRDRKASPGSLQSSIDDVGRVTEQCQDTEGPQGNRALGRRRSGGLHRGGDTESQRWDTRKCSQTPCSTQAHPASDPHAHGPRATSTRACNGQMAQTHRLSHFFSAARARAPVLSHAHSRSRFVLRPRPLDAADQRAPRAAPGTAPPAACEGRPRAAGRRRARPGPRGRGATREPGLGGEPVAASAPSPAPRD